MKRDVKLEHSTVGRCQVFNSWKEQNDKPVQRGRARVLAAQKKQRPAALQGNKVNNQRKNGSTRKKRIETPFCVYQQKTAGQTNKGGLYDTGKKE